MRSHVDKPCPRGLARLSRPRSGSHAGRIVHRSQAWACRRGGFSLIELLVVITVIGLLIALLVPAVQEAREAARRAHCRNNLKQFGIALHNYHDVFNSFPLGGSQENPPQGQFFGSATAGLLPYFEQANLAEIYDYTESWDTQPNDDKIASTIPLFRCPSNTGPDKAPVFGNKSSVINYIYSAGVNDTQCINQEDIPVSERGPFGVNTVVQISAFKDGASNTFAMGEGATGPDWNLCRGTSCLTTHAISPPAAAVFGLPAGRPWKAYQIWSAPQSSDEFLYGAVGLLTAGIYGCTIERLNKTPVTDTMWEPVNNPDNCTSSLVDSMRQCSMSNFRSDHAGGGFFLYADGSVDFVSEFIDLSLYRGLSTIGGNEVSLSGF